MRISWRSWRWRSHAISELMMKYDPMKFGVSSKTATAQPSMPSCMDRFHSLPAPIRSSVHKANDALTT